MVEGSQDRESRQLKRRLRRPPAHWFVLAVLLVVLVLMLVTASVLHGGDDSVPLGSPALREPAATGPVLDLAGPTLRSGRGDGSTVGLALVGLPDDTTVRSVLATLEREGATASWYVSGRDAAWRSGILREIERADVELGVTGYGDVDLRGEPGWRSAFQLSATQAALAARVGKTAPVLLLPATPTRQSLDSRALRTARDAARRGYLLVAGSPPGSVAAGDVAVVTVEDRNDVAPREVRTFLADQRRAGLRVASVGETVGIGPEETNRTVDQWTRINAWLLLGAVIASTVVAEALPVVFIPVTALLLLRAVLTVVFGFVHSRRRPIARRWSGPVSVVVPAYNEATGIEATVRSIAGSTWRHGLEIIVVDDGSTDGTADIADALDVASLTVIRQRNTGKPGALNSGIAAATADVVVLVDGDTIFQADTIGELVAPFSDSAVGAVSGNAKVANRSSLLGRWQHIEYVMGFNLDRRLLDVFNAIATIPGAIGAFRRPVILDVGGVSDDTIAEDTDVTIAVNRAGWRVVYAPSAIAWTEAPSTVGDLWRQRYRWSYGVLQAVWKHRRAFVERRPIGAVGLSYALVFQVLIALVAPVVDVAALYAAATGSMAIVFAWLGFAGLQLVLAAVAFRLDGESLRPLWSLPLKQVFYRQLMYLVVIQSVASAVVGVRLRWHKLHRVGIGRSDAASAHAASPPARTP